MSRIRVCFCGTPEFAATCLAAVIDDPHYEVVGVVTQPDRPAGRKMQLTPSPVKKLAVEKGLKVISPEKVNHETSLLEIKSWGAEVAIVVAFGQILSQKFLDLFPLGAVNVHGSLLPKWRGAAPIQRSLEAGDSVTGVALQKIVRELDAGDVLGVRKINLNNQIDAKDLYEQMAKLGGDLLHIELMDYVRGNLSGTPQDHSLATYAKKIDKNESQINWNNSAKDIHNKIRAFAMGPGTYTLSKEGLKIKIHRTHLLDTDVANQEVVEKTLQKINSKEFSEALPGQVFCIDQKVFIKTGDQKLLELIELQPESRNRMLAGAFIKNNYSQEIKSNGIVENLILGLP